MEHDEHHVALPKLYGAPAYARPPRVFETDDRPADPDDLPLEAYRADDGIDALGSVDGPGDGGVAVPRSATTVTGPATGGGGGGAMPEGGGPASHHVEPHPFSVRRLQRILQRH